MSTSRRGEAPRTRRRMLVSSPPARVKIPLRDKPSTAMEDVARHPGETEWWAVLAPLTLPAFASRVAAPPSADPVRRFHHLAHGIRRRSGLRPSLAVADLPQDLVDLRLAVFEGHGSDDRADRRPDQRAQRERVSCGFIGGRVVVVARFPAPSRRQRITAVFRRRTPQVRSEQRRRSGRQHARTTKPCRSGSGRHRGGTGSACWRHRAA